VSEELIKSLEDTYMANVYHKRPVVIVRGKGALVWDINGKEYIDCVAGHGVAILGHCHPKVVSAIKEQAEKLITCPCTFYNDVRAKLVEKIAEITPEELNKSFLSNSGAEAVECAIKIARAYTKRRKLIATKRGFHGRTLGALSLTWKPEYREAFTPLLPDVEHVPFGNEEALKEKMSNEVAAVVLEPIQGEAGIYLPPDGYLKAVREICDDYKALLIFDEVQTGFGRTGKMFACEHWKVYPDILCMAKGIGGGFPIGVTVTREEIMKVLKPGMHGSTYGGNPLACAAALAAIDVILEDKLYERAERLGKYFKERLMGLLNKYNDIIREVRGLGLMLATQLRFAKVPELILKALEKGVLLLPSGRTIIRKLPPLVIEREQIDRVVEVLDEIFGDFVERRSKVST